jgi:hypothetical protein
VGDLDRQDGAVAPSGGAIGGGHAAPSQCLVQLVGAKVAARLDLCRLAEGDPGCPGGPHRDPAPEEEVSQKSSLKQVFP